MLHMLAPAITVNCMAPIADFGILPTTIPCNPTWDCGAFPAPTPISKCPTNGAEHNCTSAATEKCTWTCAMYPSEDAQKKAITAFDTICSKLNTSPPPKPPKPPSPPPKPKPPPPPVKPPPKPKV